MREKTIRIVVAGIGGYGKIYPQHLLAPLPPALAGAVQLVGVADPAPQRCEHYAKLVAAGVPIYPSLERFYETERADLAVIATPVQLHAAHIELALSHGSHVLCEKPLASSLADARRLLRARDRAGRNVSLGYQWSYCPAVRELKRDIAAGLLGKPLRMRTLILWPRGDQYYARNKWAGRLRDDNGLLVLDSPLHNACAHFVHNAFYVLGNATEPHAWPTRVTAELYRAHPTIENYDTAAVRCRIGGGLDGDDVDALFLASHAVPLRRGPDLFYEFERAVVTYEDDLSGGPASHLPKLNGHHNGNANGNGIGNANGNGIGEGSRGVLVARFDDGTIKHYGKPSTSDNPAKLWHAVEAIRDGRAPICGIEATAAQTALVAAAQESMSEIQLFDRATLREDLTQTGQTFWVPNLSEQLTECFRTMRLPSECGLPWARRGRPVPIAPFASALDVTISQVARPATAAATAAATADRPHVPAPARLAAAPRATRA